MGEKRVIEQVASNEVHNDDWFLKDSPTQDTSKISATNLKAILGADGTLALDEIANAIAEDYDSTSTYNKDDFAFYENKLYRCLANNTTGTWDGTKWEEFDLPTALITTAHNIETAEFTIGTYYSADDLVLKDGKLYQCVVFHNATEWKSQFWNVVTIDEMLEYISNSIALEHNQSTVYAVGDLVMHNKILWRCIQAGAGAFVNANWELVTVADLIAEARKIDDVQVKTTGDYETVVENKIAKIDLSSVTAYGSVSNLPQAIATFKDGADAPMKSLKVAIEPQQEGSGDPSPTNVRPISGCTECEVGVAGKNMWSSGDVSGTKSEVVNTYIPSGEYTISFVVTSSDTDGTTSLVTFTYIDNTNLNIRFDRNTRTSKNITLDKAVKSITFYAGYNSVQSSTDTFAYNNIQLEKGSTATTYEPYNGQTYNIQFTVNGETKTIYDGHVEVVNDKVKVIATNGLQPLTNWNWARESAGGGNYRFRSKSTVWSVYQRQSTSVLSSAFKINRSPISGAKIDNTLWVHSDGLVYIYCDTYTDATEFKEFVKDTQLLLPLITPIEYDLSDVSINTLLGSNNVWADTGDINECIYRRDMSSTIDDIIARLEALEG